MPALVALGMAFLVGVGCGGTGHVSSSGSTGTTGAGAGVITGAGGGHTSSSSSAAGGGGNATTTTTTTTTDDPEAGPPYPIVLCHGFFGFDKLAGIPGLPYFYHVPERLEKDGETMVTTPAVDPFNSSDFRAEQLITHIQDVLAKTGKKKVILIGHSQGGLDARAVAVKEPDLVAAVVTVATPHYGSPVADIALGLLDDPKASALLDMLAQVLGGPLYDQIGNETSISKALYLFTQPGIAEFNKTHPDQPGIFYASITGRSSLSLGGQECAPDVDLPWVYALHGDEDTMDPLFSIPATMLSGGIGGKIPNDGLVRVEDAKWGEFWGCMPADHMDEVGQLVGDNPGIGNDFDHREMFSSIVKHLRSKGF